MSKRPAFQDWKKVKFKKQEKRVRGEHDFSIRLDAPKKDGAQQCSLVPARLSRYTAHTAYAAIQPYTPYIIQRYTASLCHFRRGAGSFPLLRFPPKKLVPSKCLIVYSTSAVLACRSRCVTFRCLRCGC